MRQREKREQALSCEQEHVIAFSRQGLMRGNDLSRRGDASSEQLLPQEPPFHGRVTGRALLKNLVDPDFPSGAARW